MEMLRIIGEYLEAGGGACAMATVVDTIGPAYRRAGARQNHSARWEDLGRDHWRVCRIGPGGEAFVVGNNRTVIGNELPAPFD